jgi:hypothetical protein
MTIPFGKGISLCLADTGFVETEPGKFLADVNERSCPIIGRVGQGDT